MGRTAKQGLSFHARKGFRVSCGKKADGGYRTFWLGHDRSVATYAAEMYRRRWLVIESEGRAHWEQPDEQAVRDNIAFFVHATTQAVPARWQYDLGRAAAIQQDVAARQDRFRETFAAQPPASPASARSPAPAPTLHAAVDAYCVALKGQNASESHRERQRQLMVDLKHHRPDVPLASVDRLWLQSLTDFLKTRPLSKRGTPLAPLTVRNTLRAWSRFFGWLDDNAESPRFGHWHAPRRYRELFSVRVKKLMTKVERDAAADGPVQLTPEQIVRLYTAARSDLHRICVLLGVFAALGQKEIASLRRSEFDLSKGVLRHRRSKTGQLGQYHLPPEAVAMIRRYFAAVPTDAEGTAFFTADGTKLVNATSDAVRQAWTDIVDRVNKDGGPKITKGQQGFYHLRKFAADYAMRRGGKELRDAFLAHAPDDVGGQHYSNARDFAAVSKAGKALHAELKKLGMWEKSHS